MTERQRLLRLIEDAFRGVELGDGVSLHETVVLDDYGTPEERQAARGPDEKRDWRELVGDPELVRPSVGGVTGGGLAFYDAAGMRFHLPAYLSAAVAAAGWEDTRGVGEDLLYLLTHPRPEQFALLDAAQRACVREALAYLRALLDWPENGPIVADIDRAVDGYWANGPA